MSALEVAKQAKWWVALAMSFVGAGFTVAVTLGSMARASDVARIEHRLTVVETSHQDLLERLDWITRVLWNGRTTEPPPPPVFHEHR